jgi:peptide-methionine (S)-S-oxide reductase
MNRCILKMNENEQNVCSGETNHAEAVQLKFDKSKVAYKDLVYFFFRMHDPTTLNRQGNDRGTQYRSVFFYHNEEQKKIIEQVKEQVEKEGRFKDPIVTEISEFTNFYKAEEYHQKYLEKNPGGKK